MPANRTSIDSRPAPKPTAREVRDDRPRCVDARWRGRCRRACCSPPHVTLAQALPQAGGRAERPFAPPPRVERTLPTACASIAVRYATVPKVSAILTIQSGLAVDPAEKAGLAQFVADAAQEGTTTRDSEQIKREIFAMGATLTGAAGQDTSSFTMRGLADTLPQMLTLLADVVRNPTFPQAEIELLKANTAQRLQAQLASPQFVANKLFRQTLFGSHPYARIGATPETLPAIDRASIVEYPQDLLPSEQRLPGRDRRRRARGGVRGRREGVRRLGARRGAGAASAAAAGAQGPQDGVRAAAQQRAVVDLGRQLHDPRATIRAGPC